MTWRHDVAAAERGAWIISATAIGILVAVAVLQRWPGDRHWATTVLSYSPQFIWPILPFILLAWALATGARTLVAVNALGLIFALLVPGGICVNLTTRVSDPDLTVVSQNLFGQARRAEEFELAEWLQCDIICLQETAEDGFAGLLPGYQEARAGDLRTFVRGKILSTEFVSPGAPGLPDALACEVTVRGRRLDVLNVHIEMSQSEMAFPYWRRLWPDYLTHTLRVRRLQLDAIEAWLARRSGLVIVAGDFNAPPTSSFHSGFSRTLTDCFAASGYGAGYTFTFRDIPIFRIDYIWAGAGLRPVKAWTGPAGPSDHRSVIAQIAFADGK